MFACHTIQNTRNSAGTPHPSYAGRTQEGYASHHAQHSYDVLPSSYTLPPVNVPSPSYGHFVGSLPSYSSPWSSHSDSSPFQNYNSSPTHTLSSLPTPCPLRETSYGTQPSGRPSNYGDTRGPQHGYQPTPSPDLEYTDRHRPDNIGLSISSPADIVPPPRHRVSPGSTREPVSGRNSNRPVGILRCTSCKVTSSPEWRKGPSGKKELCNAFVISHIFCVTNCFLTCGLVVVSAMLALVRKRRDTWRRPNAERRRERARLRSRKRVIQANRRRLQSLVLEPEAVHLKVGRLHQCRLLVRRLEAKCTPTTVLSPPKLRLHHHRTRSTLYTTRIHHRLRLMYYEMRDGCRSI